MITLLIILQAIAFGTFSAYIASQKNRSVEGWFVLGFLFSFLALIAIAGVPPLQVLAKKQPQQAGVFDGDWVCSNCGHQNSSGDGSCERCTVARS